VRKSPSAVDAQHYCPPASGRRECGCRRRLVPDRHDAVIQRRHENRIAPAWRHSMLVCFDPETLTLLRSTLDSAWASLPPSGRASTSQSILAERVLKAAAQGERDPDRFAPGRTEKVWSGWLQNDRGVNPGSTRFFLARSLSACPLRLSQSGGGAVRRARWLSGA
jgi:hypothetical protein